MNINQFIHLHNLQPGDAVELICPNAGFPKHYAIFLDTRNGHPEFIANITEGVQIIKKQQLLEFISKYQVTRIERFPGNIKQRKNAIKKAISRLGEKEYNLVFNNCEHFKNWALYGNSKSNQVEQIGTATLLGGSILFVTGILTDKKRLQKAGLIIILAIPLLVILIAIYYASRRTSANYLT